MNLLYNSDSYAVVQIELADEAGEAGPPDGDTAAASRGGYEIVDKFARKGVFLDGAVAISFRQGVEALSGGSPSTDEIDDYIAGFTVLAQQPVLLH
ncbi:MAG TPA: DUF3567 domain-containing protein [Ideonella sp.]|nr:DUF3567 domain-containing protein [Ideonella sp.]